VARILRNIYPKYDRLDLPLKPQSCSSARTFFSMPLPSLCPNGADFKTISAPFRASRGALLSHMAKIRRRKQRFPMEKRMEADGKHECYAKAGENVRARAYLRRRRPLSRLPRRRFRSPIRELGRSFPVAADSFGGINQA